MIGIDVSTDINITAEDVRQAERQRRMDAATKGFAVSQELVPEDRGTLRQSGFQPELRGDDVVYGYEAPYAEPMEFGTAPFTPPLRPLKEWAGRVLGDESLGYPVQQKIAQEGIDAQPFLRPSAEEANAWLDSHPLGEYLDE